MCDAVPRPHVVALVSAHQVYNMHVLTIKDNARKLPETLQQAFDAVRAEQEKINAYEKFVREAGTDDKATGQVNNTAATATTTTTNNNSKKKKNKTKKSGARGESKRGLSAPPHEAHSTNYQWLVI
jgi:hypothetical protein